MTTHRIEVNLDADTTTDAERIVALVRLWLINGAKSYRNATGEYVQIQGVSLVKSAR